MKKTVICPGSFDPVTLGHLDIIKRSANMFDHVIVGVLVNSSKTPCFSIDERIGFLKEVTQDIPNVEVVSFDGLLAQYCKERNVDAIVKGLRAVSDFEYELQLSQANSALCSDIKTVFLTTKPKYNFISSSTIKEIYLNNGDISKFVPEPVYEFLKSRNVS